MPLNQYYVIYYVILDLWTFQKKSNPLGSFDIIKNGDVAQLARAFDWQSRGRGFESLLIHKFY